MDFDQNSFLRAQEITKHRLDTDIERDGVDDYHWRVKSQSGRFEGIKWWNVYFSFQKNKWECDCTAAWRSEKYCKHVLSVIIKLNDEKRARNDK